MFENTKVIRDFVWADLSHKGIRKEYGFGNNEHGKRESRAEIYKHMRELARKLIQSTGMELEVIGREHLPIEGPVLYVATHKSVFDIIVLLDSFLLAFCLVCCLNFSNNCSIKYCWLYKAAPGLFDFTFN